MFASSGAVLMLEILSLRLVAPFVGLTLQTSTAVIGFALGAISLGAWLGGKSADRKGPRLTLGPAVLAGGIAVLFVGPMVRWTGGRLGGTDASAVLVVAAVAVFVPSALLSAVSPMVVKLRLQSLEETGEVVGRLSGVGTLGALVSTFVTGFLLVARVSTGIILLMLGAALTILGYLLTVRLRRAGLAPGALAVAALGVMASLSSSPACDVETAYHCARIQTDPARPSGRTLRLDTLANSYVDLADPTYIEYSYLRAMISVLEAARPGRGPLRALHIGGGGLTFPRYLAATRPGTDSLVLEIDPGVIDLNLDRLGLQMGSGLRVKVQDARVGLSQQPTNSRDLVVGDAFNGLSVPWHLTTRQTIAAVRRILVPEGVYMVNVIDYPPLRFARAEAATMASQFANVVIIAAPSALAGETGGNLVMVGSDNPLALGAIRQRLLQKAPELGMIAGREPVRSFAGDAKVLTDDFAPVDQLLTPYPSSGLGAAGSNGGRGKGS